MSDIMGVHWVRSTHAKTPEDESEHLPPDDEEQEEPEPEPEPDKT